nr:MAG TPA: hypothetical protein [Caudoviricetes sp.]
MKTLTLYLQELRNITMGFIPFISSIFADSPISNNDIEARLKTEEDKEKFQQAVRELKGSHSKKETTITLSDNKEMTIMVM